MEPRDDKTRDHFVLSKGTMVSHYRIVEKIGAGGICGVNIFYAGWVDK
jgi:hypothetical protein